jgi:hypothetical protein
MPKILTSKEKSVADVFDCLQVLSYYWNNKVLPGLGVKIMPAARQRFIDLMQRHTCV